MVQQKTERLLEQWVHEYENDPEFIAEGLSVEVIEEALRLLKDGDHSQTWLANNMGVSRAHVSRLFNARPNLTLLTLARLAAALGTKPMVVLDSGNLFIRSLNQPMDFEEFQTDAGIFAARRSDAQSTFNSVGKSQREVFVDAST